MHDDFYLYERELEGNAVAYKYGFNDMENDNEVKGDGNSYDFGARIYDSRLGRWLSNEPLFRMYPFLSPYCFVANMPIAAIDPDGRKIVIAGSPDFVKQTQEYLEMIRATDIGREVVRVLEECHNEYTITLGFTQWGTDYNVKTNILKYDPNLWIKNLDGGAMNSFISFAHELFHAYSDETNSYGVIANIIDNEDRLEYCAVWFQNYITSVYGMGRMRTHYTGRPKLTFPSNEQFYNSDMEKISNFKFNQTYNFPYIEPGKANKPGEYSPSDNTNVKKENPRGTKTTEVSYEKSRKGEKPSKKSEKREVKSGHKSTRYL